MSAAPSIDSFDTGDEDSSLFAKIASDLTEKGYSISPGALPMELAQALMAQVHTIDDDVFEPAGIGRKQVHMHNEFVRSDKICWITGESDAGSLWLDWAAGLQAFLNRRLFLGLFSFESHLAYYGPGDFYKRHYDAFKGERTRVVSIVVYLNRQWAPTDGGELVLYHHDGDHVGTKVTPALGTIAVFLSEEFPHEVLPALRDRYSIAGWFRVNGSSLARVDPPS